MTRAIRAKQRRNAGRRSIITLVRYRLRDEGRDGEWPLLRRNNGERLSGRHEGYNSNLPLGAVTTYQLGKV